MATERSGLSSPGSHWLSLPDLYVVSHELAVRCHLRPESSTGSARLHIQDGSLTQLAVDSNCHLAAQLGLST